MQLLSRLELADRLAGGNFSLSLVELAQLVELPLKQLELRQSRGSGATGTCSQRRRSWTLQRREPVRTVLSDRHDAIPSQQRRVLSALAGASGQ